MESYLDISGNISVIGECAGCTECFTTEKHDAEARDKNYSCPSSRSIDNPSLAPSFMTPPCQQFTKILPQDPPESKSKLFSLAFLLFELHKTGCYWLSWNILLPWFPDASVSTLPLLTIPCQSLTHEHFQEYYLVHYSFRINTFVEWDGWMDGQVNEWQILEPSLPIYKPSDINSSFLRFLILHILP